MAFTDFLFGSPEKYGQISQFGPQQQELQNSSINRALSLLQNPQGMSQQGFEPIAKKYTNQFYSETVPSIAERFTSMGGGQRSSAFQGALGQAGAGLSTNLSALGSQYGLQKEQLQNSLLNSLLGYGLVPNFQSTYRPQQQGFAQSGVEILLKLLPLLIGV